MKESIALQLIGAAGLIISAIISIFKFDVNIFKKKKNPIEELEESLASDNKINDMLSYIRDKYGFNRVYLTDFHNGVVSLCNISFKSASIRHERTDYNTRPIILDYQNIPCSLISETLIDLEKNKNGYVVVGADDLNDRVAIIHKVFGIKEAWDFKIGDSIIYGIIGCVRTNERIILSQDSINDIKSICQKIYMVRNNKSKSK